MRLRCGIGAAHELDEVLCTPNKMLSGAVSTDSGKVGVRGLGLALPVPRAAARLAKVLGGPAAIIDR